MANQSSELLATIGAIQTLVENFPTGLLTALNVKKYSSSLEFLLDALRTLGVNDQDIINFILEKLIGVNDLETILNYGDEPKFLDNAFINKLESSVKTLVAQILAEITSCSIRPKVPADMITSGLELPLSVIDMTSLLDTCPTSINGRKKYMSIPENAIPSTLSASTDLDAFIWYCINILSPNSREIWSGTTKTTSICSFENVGYKSIKFRINDAYEGETLYRFNKDYLNSIKIFSPKVILTNIFEELMNGLPNVEVSLGIEDIYSEAVLKKMIDTIVSNDDMEVDDCYYTFSNDDWNRMIEDSELRKYNARKYGDAQNSASIVDKEKAMETLDMATSAATIHDKMEYAGDALYGASKTRTIEYDALVDEASYEQKLGLYYEYNTAWLYNILSSIVRPIVKSVMTPKVIELILVNYQIAGALNLSEINGDSLQSVVIDFIKTKLMGIIAALVKQVKDIIVQAVLDFFTEKIEPLIAKFAADKLLEELEDYLNLLRQALECISIFGFPYILGNGVKTDIDEVNYADITPTKNKPNKTVC